jgi:Mrp family chromosome partitioning ATPase
VKAGAGTTTIVTDTALALTRLGAPALAVEANAYRADARYRDPNSRGLAVVLRGAHLIETAVVPGDQDFPDFIPVGDIDNQRNLPDVLNLISLLKDSAKVYDFVLLDLPPLMVSADAEILARSADVTVLVVEAEATTKGELRQAAKALERLRPKAAAAIMNKVSAKAGGDFGTRALHEFRTGTPPASPKWATPWLWR